MIKILFGAALGVAMSSVVFLFLSSQDSSLPKLSDDISIVGEAEYHATKVPCRALVYRRFGDETREVKTTTAWRKDGYTVVEMALTTKEGRYEFRLCVVNPQNPDEAVLLEEKDRPYWFDPDSEETYY